jgi:cellulose synthase/poly-beta-1,6-N-acetylglucosamine synthase-like glycosyltransferase
MLFFEVAFWTTTILLVWAYIGYPLFIRYCGRLLPTPVPNRRPAGDVLLLISAYNEAEVIRQKLENSLLLVPRGQVTIVAISDGSTDGTDAIVRAVAAEHPQVRLIRVEGRQGKNHALNLALEQLRPGPDTVLVFSDANALYQEDAVLFLRRALEDGARCAVGKLQFVDASTGTARAEGLYWRYENALKAAEGALGRMPIANGAIFAIRASDLPILPLGVGNDFWIPVTLLGLGQPVVYVPTAMAQEPAPEESREEFGRKVRMGNRSMRGVVKAWPMLDFATRFQLISHKVLRWVGLPLWAVSLATGSMLALQSSFYLGMAAALALPALLALIGLAGRALGRRVPIADLAVHLFLVHMAALWGVLEAARGKRRVTWDLARSARRNAA